MWAQIKPFWAYYLPKIKTSNTKHNHETPHVHYTGGKPRNYHEIVLT